jgi:hypothetical protein
MGLEGGGEAALYKLKGNKLKTHLLPSKTQDITKTNNIKKINNIS